jgi:hypothetical protein
MGANARSFFRLELLALPIDAAAEKAVEDQRKQCDRRPSVPI